MSKKIKVKVKEGFKHTLLPSDHDPKAKPKGAPGPRAVAGDVIEVTEAELESFGDKFDVLPKSAPRRRVVKAKVQPKPPKVVEAAVELPSNEAE